MAAQSPRQDAVVILTLAEAASGEAALDAFFAREGIERGERWRGSFRYFRTAQSASSSRVVGLVGFVEHQGRLFRLLSYASGERWAAYRGSLEESLASFRRLTARRYLDVEPKRIDLVKLDRAMTLAEFHRTYPSTVELGDLAILNGIAAGERLAAGRWVKRVVGGELPGS